MKKKVLLINPRKGQQPPLGLLYIASYVRQAGYHVRIIEFLDETYFLDNNKKLWDELYEFDPDFIGLGIISWNRTVAKSIIQKIIKTTSEKIIICGHKDPIFDSKLTLVPTSVCLKRKEIHTGRYLCLNCI